MAIPALPMEGAVEAVTGAVTVAVAVAGAAVQAMASETTATVVRAMGVAMEGVRMLVRRR